MTDEKRVRSTAQLIEHRGEVEVTVDNFLSLEEYRQLRSRTDDNE